MFVKILLALLLSLIAHTAASQSDNASPSVTTNVMAYIEFSESRTTQLVAETRKVLKEPLTVQAANRLTGDIMQASSESESYYQAALKSASANSALLAAIEAFRAEELRVPGKLGNTDEEQLDQVAISLIASGNRVRRQLGVAVK